LLLQQRNTSTHQEDGRKGNPPVSPLSHKPGGCPLANPNQNLLLYSIKSSLLKYGAGWRRVESGFGRANGKYPSHQKNNLHFWFVSCFLSILYKDKLIR
jgi:hypothetical protein